MDNLNTPDYLQKCLAALVENLRHTQRPVGQAEGAQPDAASPDYIQE